MSLSNRKHRLNNKQKNLIITLPFNELSEYLFKLLFGGEIYPELVYDEYFYRYEEIAVNEFIELVRDIQKSLEKRSDLCKEWIKRMDIIIKIYFEEEMLKENHYVIKNDNNFKEGYFIIKNHISNIPLYINKEGSIPQYLTLPDEEDWIFYGDNYEMKQFSITDALEIDYSNFDNSDILYSNSEDSDSEDTDNSIEQIIEELKKRKSNKK